LRALVPRIVQSFERAEKDEERWSILSAREVDNATRASEHSNSEKDGAAIPGLRRDDSKALSDTVLPVNYEKNGRLGIVKNVAGSSIYPVRLRGDRCVDWILQMIN
jgi:hypothetical protein